jgi:hypothetical protein
MRKLVLPSVAIAAALAVPAQAAKPPKTHRCEPHRVAYIAAGTLVSQSLTQVAGAGTATQSDDRYDGTVTIDLTRVNHHARNGDRTYTLDDARVRFYDRNGDGTADQPAAGDRVKVIAKVTVLRKRCDSTGFTRTITVRKIQFKPATA